MTEPTKSTKPTKPTKLERKGSTSLVSAYKAKVAPFCLEYIRDEINGGRSSMLLAFAGALHLNDFLHQAGLITDDCWNAVKGMSTLFSETANITAIANSVGSVLKTVVEGVTTVTGQEEKLAEEAIKQATKLASLGGAAAAEGA